MTDASVLIAGGGPVGLTLALELDRHGVDAILVERNPTTTRHPKMDITNPRSMELFRRLGVVDALREAAVPQDHDYGVIWCTRLSEWELTRFWYPSVKQQREHFQQNNDGSSALEPSMRVSQVLLEPVLKRRLQENCPNIDVRFGWQLDSFEDDGDGVLAKLSATETGETRTLRTHFLAGCDGAGSVTRKSLGIDLHDLTPRNPEANLTDSGGASVEGGSTARRRLYMIHFRTAQRELMERFGRAWHLQSPLGWSVIAQNDVDTWTIHIPVKPDDDPEQFDPEAVLFGALGCQFECEILVANPWWPRLSLADSYGRGRVWLAGDSAHQVIPSGGYGMNTGIGDAVALGWALAGNVQGWGGAGLLTAYEIERRHVGLRNREGSARHAGLRADIRMKYTPEIHEDTSEGANARRQLAAYIDERGNLENEAWGLEWGYRYDESPVICHETGEAPAYDWEQYEPSTWPGSRAPNIFMDDGAPLYDQFGPAFTLVVFDGAAHESFVDAAAKISFPLEVLPVRSSLAARLYERKLVLVRPDQHIAWRGDVEPNGAEAALEILNKVRGVS